MKDDNPFISSEMEGIPYKADKGVIPVGNPRIQPRPKRTLFQRFCDRLYKFFERLLTP